MTLVLTGGQGWGTRRAQSLRRQGAVGPAALRVWAAALLLCRDLGRPPTVRQVAAAVGRGPQTVHRTILRLRQVGLLEPAPTDARRTLVTRYRLEGV